MTPDELLDKVQELVGEHCQGFVFIAEVDSNEFEAGLEETQMVWGYNGGMTLVNGMIRRASKELDRLMDQQEGGL